MAETQKTIKIVEIQEKENFDDIMLQDLNNEKKKHLPNMFLKNCLIHIYILLLKFYLTEMRNLTKID